MTMFLDPTGMRQSYFLQESLFTIFSIVKLESIMPLFYSVCRNDSIIKRFHYHQRTIQWRTVQNQYNRHNPFYIFILHFFTKTLTLWNTNWFNRSTHWRKSKSHIVPDRLPIFSIWNKYITEDWLISRTDEINAQVLQLNNRFITSGWSVLMRWFQDKGDQ